VTPCTAPGCDAKALPPPLRRASELCGSVELPAPVSCRKRRRPGADNGLQRGAARSVFSALVVQALLPQAERARQVAARAPDARPWGLTAWVSSSSPSAIPVALGDLFTLCKLT
jgi:hypothetical protein